ncbi:MAG TPA: cytochrome c oxidase assembly protein [Hyphomicrobiaceae bacterium]
MPGHTLQKYLTSWPLWAGLLVLAFLWLGPLPAMSRRAFSPHMILHLAVTSLAAPLIVAGLLRSGVAVRISRQHTLFAVGASIFELAVVWGWHLPELHQAAALDDTVYVAQQLSFLAAGIAIWWASFAGMTKVAYAIGGLALVLTFVHMAMLGLLIGIAPELIYEPSICLGAFGFDPLEDQHFGGSLMAVVGGTPYLIAGIFLLNKFISEHG